MGEAVISREEKGQTYARLHERLAEALEKGFWLEATMIEYNIIEDRTAAIVYYADLAGKAWKKGLENKIESIKMQLGKKHPLLLGKVSPATLEQIREWKDRRNNEVHNACSAIYDEDVFRSIAEDGKKLVDAISNDSKKVRRAAEAKEKNTLQEEQ